jgi:hypothetical protein
MRIFVFNGGMDVVRGILRVRMRHRLQGWETHATSGDMADLVSASEEDRPDGGRGEIRSRRQQLEFATRHIRENYDIVGWGSENALQSAMEELVLRVPKGGKFVILLDDERRRSNRGGLRIKRERVHYNIRARAFAARFPFGGAASLSDAIESEDEILQGGSPTARTVYWRAAEKIEEVALQPA